MKKTILILAAAFAAIVSCQKAETDNTAPVLTKITVEAENSLGADTKVTVGEKNKDNVCPVLWQAGDRVCLIDRTSEQPRTILAVATVPSEYDKSQSANLTFDVDFAEYPYTNTLGLMVCREGFLYNDSKEIPQNQVQKGLGAENTNMMDYMYGYTQTTRSCRDKDGNVISNLSFSIRHPFAYVKIPFWSTKFAGYKVTSIVLTNVDGAKRLSGRMTINGAAAPSDAIVAMHASQDNVNLTFSEDVVVPGSADQAKDAWLVAIPTAIKGETAIGSVYSVTFNLEDGQGKTVTAVAKFKTILNAESVNVLKVGEILESDVTESKDIANDFFEQYRAGHDIVIGNLVVNKENYPEYTLEQPSDIKLDLLKKGGLIFIDDVKGDSEIVLTTDNTSETCPNTSSDGLVLIGRYKIAGKQTELKFNSWRTSADIAFANVKITADGTGLGSTTDQLFSKSRTDETMTALRFKDCYIDNSARKEFIRDVQETAVSGVKYYSKPYSDITLDNCVLRLSNTVASTTAYLLRGSLGTTETVTRTFVNSVIYLNELVNLDSWMFRSNSDDYDASSMIVNISNNTILNVQGDAGVIRRPTKLGSMIIGGNLVVADNANNIQLSKNLFRFVRNTTNASAGKNFLTVIGYTGESGTIGEADAANLTTEDSDMVKQIVDPFLSTRNYTNAYFPVNTSVVTNGAGASYETKYFIPQN